jgi:hypothetical protein
MAGIALRRQMVLLAALALLGEAEGVVVLR